MAYGNGAGVGVGGDKSVADKPSKPYRLLAKYGDGALANCIWNVGKCVAADRCNTNGTMRLRLMSIAWDG